MANNKCTTELGLPCVLEPQQTGWNSTNLLWLSSVFQQSLEIGHDFCVLGCFFLFLLLQMRGKNSFLWLKYVLNEQVLIQSNLQANLTSWDFNC